ncbi:unnamed protein product [Closterium sp. Yama58-4]|nr:unnamed protein product [Closterium sp. Yama58-4]
MIPGNIAQPTIHPRSNCFHFTSNLQGKQREILSFVESPLEHHAAALTGCDADENDVSDDDYDDFGDEFSDDFGYGDDDGESDAERYGESDDSYDIDEYHLGGRFGRPFDSTEDTFRDRQTDRARETDSEAEADRLGELDRVGEPGRVVQPGGLEVPCGCRFLPAQRAGDAEKHPRLLAAGVARDPAREPRMAARPDGDAEAVGAHESALRRGDARPAPDTMAEAADGGSAIPREGNTPWRGAARGGSAIPREGNTPWRGAAGGGLG